MRTDPDVVISNRKITAVIAVADAANFRLAAERLHLSQPALTRLIQSHETEIGFRIFGRDTKNVWLTPEGNAYVAACRMLSGHIRTHGETIRAIKDGKTGRLDIGHMDAATMSFMPDLIRSFSLENANIDVRMHLMGSDQQVAAIRTGHLDVGFILDQARVKGLEYRLVQVQPLCIVMSEHDPRNGRTGVALSDFANDLFIFADRNHSSALMRTVDQIFHRAGISPRMFYASHDTLSVLAQVRAGHGVTLMPRTAKQFLGTGLHYADIASNTASITVELAFDPKKRSAVAASFVRHFEARNAALRSPS